ncbi:MAG: hypothetical protein LH702_06285 [Phormidesmis sp. CAN_BIN44]|nr:hypothetical protein [Phormidesmis sp. CAN_BIN44]
MEAELSSKFRFPKFSMETWAAIGAAIVTFVGVAIYKSSDVTPTGQASPVPSHISDTSVEKTLYQAEGRRLLVEAIKQSQDPRNPCFNKGERCTLDHLRQQALSALERSYATDSKPAIDAYIRLKALSEIPTLQKASEMQSLEAFIDAQRRQQ